MSTPLHHPILPAARRRRQVGPLKNNQQLIKDLQKTAGEEPDEKAKQEKALKEVEKERRLVNELR